MDGQDWEIFRGSGLRHLKDGAVSLKRPDGQVIKIPLEKLSETDQEVARAVAQATNAAPKAPVKQSPSDDQDPFTSGIVKPAKPETPETPETTPDAKIRAHWPKV